MPRYRVTMRRTTVEIVEAPNPYQAAIVANDLGGEGVEVANVAPAVGRPAASSAPRKASTATKKPAKRLARSGVPFPRSARQARAEPGEGPRPRAAKRNEPRKTGGRKEDIPPREKTNSSQRTTSPRVARGEELHPAPTIASNSARPRPATHGRLTTHVDLQRSHTLRAEATPAQAGHRHRPRRRPRCRAPLGPSTSIPDRPVPWSQLANAGRASRSPGCSDVPDRSAAVRPALRRRTPRCDRLLREPVGRPALHRIHRAPTRCRSPPAVAATVTRATREDRVSSSTCRR